MTQPDYVPLAPGSRLRAFDELKTPQPWVADRPSEIAPLKGTPADQGKFLGTPSPGGGFALKLARVALELISLDPSEHAADIESVISAVAIKRSALFSRAPTIYDVRFALKLFGYSNSEAAPQELVKFRKDVISGAGHDYFRIRRVIEMISTKTLALDYNDLQFSLWRDYFVL